MIDSALMEKDSTEQKLEKVRDFPWILDAIGREGINVEGRIEEEDGREKK